MHYGNIKDCDIANGLGVRVSLFVSGCTHHCKGCFQPQTWNFKYGDVYTQETLIFWRSNSSSDPFRLMIFTLRLLASVQRAN